ncbi:hypothetical protein EPR50_G00057390 [Perca flavescens]|uniref:DUF4455 domain-containing protein n=1 Tax=Perca flavescens TaxID=8167 RepID=A0A484DCY9_PERFV|nr:hypothetical protein EPR50_G00057390 [Perca flavescens]
MCESRAVPVPSGKVYRQLFDAQVQLSRSLLAGRKDTRTDCLSAADSNTHCSTSSRLGQLVDEDDEDDDDSIADVSRLPDSVVVECLSSDIVERLTERKSQQHEEALKQLEKDLTLFTQVCETRVRTISQELLSSLQDVDLRLNTLKDRMEQLEQLQHVTLQDVCVLWDEVEEQVKLKKIRIVELNHKLTESETQRTNEIRAVLRKYFQLLEKISFLPPPDVCRLIHREASMLNQSLLANRRSVARLLLLLQEENLQQESLLRLHWEDCLGLWRRSRLRQVIDCFRSVCSSDEEQQPVSGQQLLQERKRALTERRDDIIYKICSLVPPSCSTALVSDWFNQLTAVNQQIDSLHADSLHQLRCSYEQKWQDRLAEVERCKEELSALQLSEDEVNHIVSSQLLTLIGRSQSQDEERLAALDRGYDCAARGALRLSRKKVRLDDLLAGLRQESREDSLKASLDKTVLYLQDFKHSCSQCVSDQCEVLDRLPSLFLEELLSYSRSLSSFFRLGQTYRPSPEELQKLLPSLSEPETREGAAIQKAQEDTESRPISWQSDRNPAQPSQDWLTEAESSLLDLCDIMSDVTFTSSRGVAYSGPAFRCPAPDLPDDPQQQETHLNMFPVELLTHTLIRMRTVFFDHLELRFHDVLSSAVAMVTDRKEAARSEKELYLQQLEPQHIETHIYQPRLAEIWLHRQQVDLHCEELVEVLGSCRVELKELQASLSRKTHEFTVRLSNVEDNVLTAHSSQRLEAVSSTLQDCLDQHIKDTQRCQTSFRQTVHSRLEEVRSRTTQLLQSFRLFSEGGDFSPQEVKLFQRRLKEQTKQISMTEESIYSELEAYESKSLQQVKEASGHLEEKLSFLKSEVEFTEKSQKIISSTQVHIKAEAASSNQQQWSLSSRLEDVRRMMENPELSPDQLFSLLSSVNEEVRKRSQYLDLPLESLSSHSKSRKQVQSAPPPGLLQTSRAGVDLLDDPAVGVIKSLHRLCVVQDVGVEAAEREDRGTTAAAQSPAQRLQQKCTESFSALSVRRGCRSIRTERRFQIFGSGPEQKSHSFGSTLNSVLWTANDSLLQVAEDFYRSDRCGLSKFFLVPESLDQWAESLQQRLLGYQDQSRKFLSTSREELVSQLSVLEELLHSLPAVLIGNLERRQEAGLREEVGGVRLKLKEALAASEEEKREKVRQLRTSLGDAELQTLDGREQQRQQELHTAVCWAHLELQECVRVREEEFVTSLGALTEQLFSQLDQLPSVTTETGASRTWSGISYLSPPTNSAAEPPCSVTVTAATTASLTTTRCTLGHLAVIEHRDAAVKVHTH